MKKVRIILGIALGLGLGVVAACSSDSSPASGGNDSGAPGTGDGTTPAHGDDSGASAADSCTGGQQLCIGLAGKKCMDPGGTCIGTTVTALDCSETKLCPSGQVCCSGYVGADGGPLFYPSDAGAATGDGGAGGGGGFSGLAVAVTCQTSCPANSATSQVCAMDGTGPACPSGTTCRMFLPFATMDLPNTLCLPPLPDGGFTFDGGFARRDSGSTVEDAAAE